MSISVRAFAKSGAGIALSAVFGVGLVKLISYHEGPEGVGAFGLFRQFFQFLAIFFTLGSGYSIVEGYPKARDRVAFIRIAASYALAVSLSLSALVLLFSEEICVALYSDLENLNLIRSIPLFLVPLSVHQLIKSALSAQGYIGLSGIATALPFFTMFVIALFSRELFDLYFYSGLLSFLLGLVLYRSPVRNLLPGFPLKRLESFERTTISAVVGGASGFLSFLAVKAVCTHRLGIWNTGLLEGAWSLVGYTTLIYLTSLSVYYLPKVSAEPEQKKFRDHYFTLINGLALASLGFICVFSSFFIHLLFTPEFGAMTKILVWMAIGEYLKCLNWVFIFSMIGLSYKKAYLALDLLANALFMVLLYLSTVSDLRDLGRIYIAFQVCYLLGNIALNFKHGMLRTSSVLANVGVGVFLWAILLGL